MTTVKDLIDKLSKFDPSLPVIADVPTRSELENYKCAVAYDAIHNELGDVILKESVCESNREPDHSFEEADDYIEYSFGEFWEDPVDSKKVLVISMEYFQ